MSIHPSLSAAIKGKQQKTVLKRRERIKYLLDKGEWTPNSSIYSLPKIKTTRLKIKKIKADKPKEGEAAETQAATAQTTAAPKAAASKKESK